MKRTLLVLALITGALLAYQKDTTIEPAALLFKRWQVYRGREVSNTVWTVQKSGIFYDLEFRQDGAVIYDKNNSVVAASYCSGTRFERTGVFLHYRENPCLPNSLLRGCDGGSNFNPEK